MRLRLALLVVAALLAAGCTRPHSTETVGVGYVGECASLALTVDREQMQVGDLVTLRVAYDGCRADDVCGPAFTPRVTFADRSWFVAEGAATDRKGCAREWDLAPTNESASPRGERAWVWNGTFKDCRPATGCYHRSAPPGVYVFEARAGAAASVASVEVLARPGEPAGGAPFCADVELVGPTSPIDENESAAVVLRIENCGGVPIEVTTPCQAPRWDPFFAHEGEEHTLQAEGPARAGPTPCAATLGGWSVGVGEVREELWRWNGMLAEPDGVTTHRAPPGAYALTSVVEGWTGPEQTAVRWDVHATVMVA